MQRHPTSNRLLVSILNPMRQLQVRRTDTVQFYPVLRHMTLWRDDWYLPSSPLILKCTLQRYLDIHRRDLVTTARKACDRGANAFFCLLAFREIDMLQIILHYVPSGSSLPGRSPVLTTTCCYSPPIPL